MDSAQVSETIAVYNSMYCVIAAMTLVVYNWLINLDHEVNLFWSSPTRGASILYFAIRYLPFWRPVFSIPTFYPISDMSCAAIIWIDQMLIAAMYIAPAIFSANRAYALSEQTRVIYCAVLVLSLGPFFVNLIDGLMWVRPVNLPPPALCSDDDSTPLSVNLMLSLTIADLIVILVTWRATYKVIKRTGNPLRTSITQVLLFNGGSYSSVLLLLNVSHIIMTELSITIYDEATSYVTIFTDPFTSILATDFLINLQKAATASHAGPDQLGSGGLLSLNLATITQSNCIGTVAEADAPGVQGV
ncbi:hypothetical protein GY45DRAFT_1320015 [Cubamyces sp. BRFM 1775]|nr:hypothetical protein GY45DRAFT_1320015 [Cubamyces sp. BRFM 1775]